MGSGKAIVFVYLPGEITAVPAGVFTLNQEDNYGNFAYGRKYLKRADALSLDPVSLPLGEKLYETQINQGVFGSFRDASMDYWGRIVYSAKAGVPPETLSELDFLMEPSAVRTGCLDFRVSAEQGQNVP